MAQRGNSKFRALLIASALLLVAGCSTPVVQRHAAVIAIPEKNIAEYKELRADTWPGVLKAIDKAGIENYSIFLGQAAPGQSYLLGYYEYTGRDFEADLDRMARDETVQKWWKRTDPLLKPLPMEDGGQWWSEWREVFHHDGPAYDESEIASRHGAIIGLPEQNILVYTQMHAAVWPGVLAAIERANIRNYSIFLGRIAPDEYLLFSYFEYIGDDFARDMETMADEVTKSWWRYTDPLQVRLPGTPPGEQWKALESLFHID